MSEGNINGWGGGSICRQSCTAGNVWKDLLMSCSVYAVYVMHMLLGWPTRANQNRPGNKMIIIIVTRCKQTQVKWGQWTTISLLASVSFSLLFETKMVRFANFAKSAPCRFGVIGLLPCVFLVYSCCALYLFSVSDSVEMCFHFS